MYDFKQIKVALSKEYILSKIDEASIWCMYYGKFELGKAYKSFFTKDNNPSCTFFVSKYGKILYYDFRTNQILDCFGFVRKMLEGIPFKDVLQLIASDFGLVNSQPIERVQEIIKVSEEIDLEAKKQTLIQFIPKDWDKKSLKFWQQYYIEQDELELNKVFPLKKLFVNKKEIYANNHERYAFVEKYKGTIVTKIYSPSDKQMKWISSMPLHCPFGLRDLPYESNVLMIQKSKKDLIVTKKFFTDVIALQNESEGALCTEVVDYLDKKYDAKILIFDSDDVGVKNCTKLVNKYQEHGYKYFNVPRIQNLEHIKDVSDFIKHFGPTQLKELFKRKNLL